MIGRTFPKIILARTGIATMLPTRWTARRNGVCLVMLGGERAIEGIEKHKP